MSNLRIAVASTNKKQLDEIVRLLQPAGAVVVPIESKLDQLGTFVNQAVPDVLIVDSACEGRNDVEPLERLGRLYPKMAFIVLCNQQSPDFLIQAMRAGVREVLPSPVNAEALMASIGRVQEKLNLQTRRDGKVLAFISCKGGSGATFLAANLGYALASLENKKVILIDLNLQFGDASLFVSEQKPITNLADIAHDIRRLDASLLASSLVNVTRNYGVLASPEDPAQGMEVKPEHIESLINLARSHYDFVILDAGRSIDAVTIKALDLADMIFPVLQLTLPFIRDGKRLVSIFRSLGYSQEKINLVVNRHDKKNDLSLDDLEHAMGMKAFRTIPNQYDVAATSVNQGVPIGKLAKNSNISKALNELGHFLAQEPDKITAGWLARMFKRA
ncbi:MAG: AAA family ATPase [Burkholderiales bacterium]